MIELTMILLAIYYFNVILAIVTDLFQTKKTLIVCLIPFAGVPIAINLFVRHIINVIRKLP